MWMRKAVAAEAAGVGGSARDALITGETEVAASFSSGCHQQRMVGGEKNDWMITEYQLCEGAVETI